MTRSLNISIQILLLLGQVLNMLLPTLHPEHRIYATVGIAFVQGIAAILAHSYNPDGTPAKVAYDPPPKV